MSNEFITSNATAGDENPFNLSYDMAIPPGPKAVAAVLMAASEFRLAATERGVPTDWLPTVAEFPGLFMKEHMSRHRSAGWVVDQTPINNLNAGIRRLIVLKNSDSVYEELYGSAVFGTKLMYGSYLGFFSVKAILSRKDELLLSTNSTEWNKAETQTHNSKNKSGKHFKK